MRKQALKTICVKTSCTEKHFGYKVLCHIDES